MTLYNKVSVKLSDSQLNKQGLTLGMDIKIFNGNNLPHELLLKKKRKSKPKKIIQSGGFLGSLLSKLAGPLMKVAVALAKIF